MKKTMQVLSIIFTIFFVVFVIIYQYYSKGYILSLAITFGVFSYHFLIRFIIGYVIDGIFHNKMDYTKKWFKVNKVENKIYLFLKVNKWKKHIPTYSPETFSLKHHSLEEIIQATCQSEIVHELIFIFSYLPILLTIFFDSFLVFLITSIIASLIDLTFVIVQRYNRPRLIRLLTRKK